MNPEHEVTQVSASGGDSHRRLVDEYDRQWQRAIQGAPPPELESWLAQVPGNEQSALRARLEELDRIHRARVVGPATAPDETIAPRTSDTSLLAGRPDTSALARTLDPERTMDPERTIDPLRTGSVAGAEAPQAPTMDFSLAPDVAREHLRRYGLPQVRGYEILNELGRGGMGVVYRAKQVGLNRLVALKMILAGGHASEQHLARFRAEAQAVAQLQHANIVQVYDVGEQDGLPFFSLEFVDGQGLDAEIRETPLPPQRAAEVVRKIASAMDYAHHRGIVHRDLKPANILMTKAGEPKVSDFGLVKRLEEDSSQTRTGTIMGTPSYMAPEQARGDKHIGPLADVYALGSILYCLLTGRPPFLAATPYETVMQVIRDEPLPPRRLQPTIPADLETISLKCLQKDPEKRYDSAAALAEDLRRFVAGEPITARPVGQSERAWRWCRRNPHIAIPSAIAALLALLVMIGGPVAAVLIYQQKVLADQASVEASRQAGIARTNEGLALKAQAAAEESQRKAEENAALAGRQQLQSLDTLRTLVYDVQTQLSDKPTMQGLRESLLNTALGGLNKVNQVTAGAAGASSAPRDPRDIQTDVEIATAGAHRRMGDIYLELGDTDSAIAQFEACHAIVERLDREGRLKNRETNLCTSWNNLGEAARRAGDSAKARQYFQLALDLRRAWSASHPQDIMIAQNVADSLGRLGAIALMQGKLDEALQHFTESTGLRRQWVEQDAGNLGARRELAGASSALGDVYLKLGNIEQAEQNFKLARTDLQELSSARPDDRSLTWNVALAHNRLGNLYLMTNQGDKAIPEYARTIELLGQMSAADPPNSRLRIHLAQGQYGMGVAREQLGEPDKAAQHFQEALSLRKVLAEEDEGNTATQASLMLSLARCGRIPDAVTIAERLSQAGQNDAHLLYHAASGYAVCATFARKDGSDPASVLVAETYAEKAAATLQAALAQGYQVSPELQLDPDLAILRGRPDFDALFARRDN